VVQHDVGVLTPAGIQRRGLRNGVTGEMDPLVVPAPGILLEAVRQAVSGLTLPPIESAEGKRQPRIVEGVIVTGDVFMSDAAWRDEIRSSLGASAVEMEGAAMVQAAPTGRPRPTTSSSSRQRARTRPRWLRRSSPVSNSVDRR